MTAAKFIIKNVTKAQFAKALISCAGLSWVNFIVTTTGMIFGAISEYHEGVTLYLTEKYAYDEYEGMGKWYLVDADYRLW